MRPLLALLLLPPLASEAADLRPGPVCARPEVLALLTENLKRAGQPFALEAAGIGEVPGATPGHVLCAVRVHRTVYDVPRYGVVPIDEPSVVQYTLELRQNGIFLSMR